jgi:hypothetical protein
MATLDSLRDRDLLLRAHGVMANVQDEDLLAPYTAADLEALREQ